MNNNNNNNNDNNKNNKNNNFNNFNNDDDNDDNDINNYNNSNNGDNSNNNDDHNNRPTYVRELRIDALRIQTTAGRRTTCFDARVHRYTKYHSFNIHRTRRAQTWQ